MQKIVFFILLLLGSFKNTFSQTTISKIGKVEFFENMDSLNSKRLHDIAKLCDCYIIKHYSKFKLLYILLDIELSKDSSYYQLSYDNLYGNSINNDIYEPKTKDYTTLGIRIKVHDSNINKESILKLLDYGINHQQELKAIRSNAIKLSYYDRPKSLSIKEKKIEQILQTEKTRKIVDVINTCSLL